MVIVWFCDRCCELIYGTLDIEETCVGRMGSNSCDVCNRHFAPEVHLHQNPVSRIVGSLLRRIHKVANEPAPSVVEDPLP